MARHYLLWWAWGMWLDIVNLVVAVPLLVDGYFK